MSKTKVIDNSDYKSEVEIETPIVSEPIKTRKKPVKKDEKGKKVVKKASKTTIVSEPIKTRKKPVKKDEKGKKVVKKASKTTIVSEPIKTRKKPVKKDEKGKKVVKKASKTTKSTKKPEKIPEKVVQDLEDDVRTSEIGEVEYSTTRKGIVTVTQRVEKKKGMFPNPYGTTPKYKPEYCEMLIDFFYKYTQEVYVDREYYDKRGGEEYGGVRPDNDGLKRHLVKRETHKVIGSTFPTIERFACQLGVHRDTLRNWANAIYPEDYRIVKLRGKHKYPQFFSAYTLASQMQEAILIEWAMDNRFNAQFSIFLAKNRFGYKDTTEVNQTTVGVVGVVGLPPEKQRALEYLISSKMQK